MSTQIELADNFRRLVSALAEMEARPEGRDKAKAIRDRINTYVAGQVASIGGKPITNCEYHQGWPAHNCGPCRSERIALNPVIRTPRESR